MDACTGASKVHASLYVSMNPTMSNLIISLLAARVMTQLLISSLYARTVDGKKGEW